MDGCKHQTRVNHVTFSPLRTGDLFMVCSVRIIIDHTG